MSWLQILGASLGVLVIGSVGFALLTMLVGWVMGPPPIFGGRNPPDRHRCCDAQSFEVTADFEHAGGVDLGRCVNCSAWLMAVWYHGSTTYNVISQERAEYFLKLQDTPELRRALKAWVD